MSLEESALSFEDEEFVDELKPDTKLMHGQYTIEGFLAAGGFGITYLARDSLSRRVVIKECFPGNFCRRRNSSVMPRSRAHQNELKSIVRLFSQEAMNLAKANHPNIVGVHQVFEENNTAYMALDFVQGRDLLEILQDDRDSLTPEIVTGYLTKVLDAIKHIHSQGMLHRDISPDNIIINERGEPILIDFGAAREDTSNENVTRMLSALRVVKDGYSPQEFYIAGSEQTPSCDLYSLAASFYHIATGELPPDSQVRLSAFAAGDDDPYVSLGKKTGGYSRNFVTALDKAMAVLPRSRMHSADEWLTHLEHGAGSNVETRVLDDDLAEVKSKEKKSALPLLLGTTTLAAVVGAGVFFMSSNGEDPLSATTASNEAVTRAEPAITPSPEQTPEIAATIAPTPVVPDLSPPEVELSAPVDVADTPAEAAAPEAPAAPFVPDPIEEDTAALALPTIDPAPAAPVDAEQILAGVGDVATDVAVLATPGESDPMMSVDLPALAAASRVAPPGNLGIVATDLAFSPPVIDTVAPETAEPEATSTLAGWSAREFFLNQSKPEQAAAPAAAAPRSQPSASAPQAAPTEAPENTAAITRFVPVLPFVLSDATPGQIVAVSVDAPNWLASDARIVSINGQAVSSNEAISERLTELAANGSDSSFDAVIGLAGVAANQTLTIAKEKHTLLLNGLKFAARPNGSGWTTEVVEAPSGSNFRVGDVLVSYVATWEALDGPNTLQTILERERESGKSSLSFAVQRDGEIWIEAFSVAS
ncbi:MAG: protein kinase [Paracoccaceae bacterium]|nr:protein kinase [Paracoccaceae bacterium]